MPSIKFDLSLLTMQTDSNLNVKQQTTPKIQTLKFVILY